MRRFKFLSLFLLVFSLTSFVNTNKSISAKAQADSSADPRIVLLDRKGQPTDHLTDGNTIRLKVEGLVSSSDSRQVSFILDGNLPVTSCEVKPKEISCESPETNTLGWYWNTGGVTKPERMVTAKVNGDEVPFTIKVTVTPRPVVLVHGFISDFKSFKNYFGPEGFLARNGLHGFSVGDGQVPGAMNTGSLDAPQTRTNTILQNAQILGQYIQGVKSLTNAEMVDLIGHSMGGMISRLYIDQVMETRDVAQLIMLGSPMGGSDCSDLPAALGFYLPASIEIRPSYMLNIFNLQVTRRKGIAFYDLAGTPIVEGIKSPCEAVPNDLVVSVNSVNAIPLKSAQMPVLHTELTINQQVYNEFVLPKLQTPVGNFQYEPDSSLSGQPAPPIQFTRLYTGSLKPGEKNDLTIQIDAGVSVASFALYDASRSLEVKVTGASGKEIILSPEQNGLMKIEDPSILFYLGYGFNNPKAGAWVIHLATTNETPADGTEYALTANFTGGATLEAQAAPLILKPGEPVTLSSKLTLDNQQLQISSAKASILQPNGQRVFVDLSPNEDGFKASWTPSQEGLHGIDLFVSGVDGTGQIVERTAFLAVQELPANPPTTISIIGLGLLLVLIIAMVIFIVYRRLRRRRMKTLVGG